MDRRAFITVVGGSILAGSLSLEGQQLSKASRVGVLLSGIAPSAVSDNASFRALRDALAQLGYTKPFPGSHGQDSCGTQTTRSSRTSSTTGTRRHMPAT